MDSFNIIVVGAGSGGVRAARMAASYGAKVAIIENDNLGGTCVNLGCVPKKLFVYASHYAEDFHDAAFFGWQQQSKPEFNWPLLRDNKNTEISRLNGIFREMLDSAGVTRIEGLAEFERPDCLRVGDSLYTADKILIATGSWPRLPDVPGIELAITSNEAFHLEQLPAHIAIVGGGYIAVEFAGIFRGLGCEVSLLYRGDEILRAFDNSVRAFVHAELENKGIKVRTGLNVTAIAEQSASSLGLTLDNGEILQVNGVMYATGRAPKVQDLQLERVGVNLGKNGAIVVDDYYRTSQPNIFAIGDVIGKVQLTPVAIAEGMAVARTMAQDEPTTLDYENIPTAVFCQPNIGTVGLTEEKARQQYDKILVYTSEFQYLRHSLTDSSERVFMKLVVDGASDRVLGVHMVGPDAGEIIQGMGVALKAGATKAVFDSTIGIHPTVAEEFVTMKNLAG